MLIKRFQFIIVSLIIVSIGLFSQCTTSPVEEFDFETQRMIDTTIRNEKRMLGKELDSLCQLKMDSLVSIAIDSVKEIRISEILDILSEESLK